LGVQDDKVVADAALRVVVELEVTSALGEAEQVQQVVVGVGSVEQLGNRGICIALPVGVGQRVGVLKFLISLIRAGIGEVA
jgi:hypothetical protein